jgi:pentatricopeptide repeat protein
MYNWCARTRLRPNIRHRLFSTPPTALTKHALPNAPTGPRRNILAAQDLAAIRTRYHLPQLQRGPFNPPVSGPSRSPNEQEVLNDLVSLAESGRTDDIALLQAVLETFPAQCNLEITASTHAAIFDSFIASGNSPAALRWLETMSTKPGQVSPSLPQWHAWIEAFGCFHQDTQFPFLFKSIAASGCQPTLETYSIAFTAMFRAKYPPKDAAVRKLLRGAYRTGVPHDEGIISSIAEGYTAHRMVPVAEQMRTSYEKLYNRQTDPHADAVVLLKRSYAQGKHRATADAERLQSQGFTPTPQTLRVLLAESTSVSDIRFWENTLRVQADVRAWLLVIQNCIQQTRSPDRAFQVYKEYIAGGMTPTSKLVDPVIRLLCMKTLRPPKESDVDRALLIYADLFHATESGEPLAPIYNSLVSALVSTRNTRKYFPKALSLLEDMKSRGVEMDSMTATSITILLLRSSSTPTEAFQAYKQTFKRPDGTLALDAEGYVAVLNVFCRLTFGKDNIHTAIPAWEQYFEIVKDMREAGFPVNVKVYSIILQQLGFAATKIMGLPSQELQEGSYYYKPPPGDVADIPSIQRAMRRIHQILLTDAAVQPDTIAWNTLMDAYQRAGCLREAYRIWESLWLSRSFDNASISIMADACGHAGAHEEAVQIFPRIMKSGFKMNVRNWNAWLECLCRLNRVREAVEVLCNEMGQNGNVEPNEDSVRVILRFARGKPGESEMKGRVERRHPELWKSFGSLVLVL